MFSDSSGIPHRDVELFDVRKCFCFLLLIVHAEDDQPTLHSALMAFRFAQTPIRTLALQHAVRLPRPTGGDGLGGG